MLSNLSLALQITAIGMGLVFAAILLLWGFMALLTRIVKEPTKERELEEQIELEGKRRAAVVAIALSLSQQRKYDGPQKFPLPPTALVSAWQAVMRTSMLSKRGRSR